MSINPLSADDQAEADRIGDALPLNDEMVLQAVQESVKSAYMEASSLEHGGAMVALSDEASAIWDAAVERAFLKWLVVRS